MWLDSGSQPVALRSAGTAPMRGAARTAVATKLGFGSLVVKLGLAHVVANVGDVPIPREIEREARVLREPVVERKTKAKLVCLDARLNLLVSPLFPSHF